jgi:hypothetical protein
MLPSLMKCSGMGSGAAAAALSTLVLVVTWEPLSVHRGCCHWIRHFQGLVSPRRHCRLPPLVGTRRHQSPRRALCRLGCHCKAARWHRAQPLVSVHTGEGARGRCRQRSPPPPRSFYLVRENFGREEEEMN